MHRLVVDGVHRRRRRRRGALRTRSHGRFRRHHIGGWARWRLSRRGDNTRWPGRARGGGRTGHDGSCGRRIGISRILGRSARHAGRLGLGRAALPGRLLVPGRGHGRFGALGHAGSSPVGDAPASPGGGGHGGRRRDFGHRFISGGRCFGATRLALRGGGWLVSGRRRRGSRLTRYPGPRWGGGRWCLGGCHHMAVDPTALARRAPRHRSGRGVPQKTHGARSETMAQEHTAGPGLSRVFPAAAQVPVTSKLWGAPSSRCGPARRVLAPRPPARRTPPRGDLWWR